MPLLQAILNLLAAVLEVVVSAGSLVAPWLPLIAWAVFWALAVNWEKLSAVIRSGAFVGIAMIALLAVLIWGCVDQPIGGQHHLLGLKVSNFVGKLVYVVGLIVIMFAAGSAQLSGMFDGLVCFGADDESADDHGHDGHGHDDHGHDAGGHGTDHGHH